MPGNNAPLDAECRRLIELLRQRCPDALPVTSLPAGSMGPRLSITPDEVLRLVRRIASPAGEASIVWTSNGNELLVDVSEVSLAFDHGLVHVSIPVRCDQVEHASIIVSFAIGDADLPAGLFAATFERPQGPPPIVGRWSEALIAYAWRLLVKSTVHIASASGSDEDGAGLIPLSIAATPTGLSLQTVARHAFDRKRP